MKLIIHDAPESWDSALASYGIKEPCQGYSIHSAYRKSMNASRAILLEASSNMGHVLYPVLLFPVPASLTTQDLFTAESVYGFSGPACSGEREFLVEAFENIKKALSELRVIVEFLRVSPFLDMPLASLVQSGYSFRGDRKLAIWRRSKLLEESRQHFSFGNMERRALKAGCEFSVDSVAIDEFKELYYTTMRLNSATDFFMYSSEYFEQLSRDSTYLTNHLFGIRRGTRLISSAWFMTANDHSVYHLGCNDRSTPGASDLLLRCSTDYLVNSLGVIAINFTGGRSLAADDSLLRFKMRFATHAEQFLIGRRILDGAAFSDILSMHSDNLNLLRLIPWR